ncbi:AAA domain-containing protein [Burkholderia sp. WP9]|uniref:AAA family ATPase n=1 Tax=Burkholderia sp. WP9 TaxID=1500263 RepID=UPI00089B2588|nr:AAA family ATPase [Burkholderia sp. WP9]SEF11681.1 AAA domain-containing protein [Burkholderia sp. WP9]
MQTSPFASTSALKKALDVLHDAYDVILIDTRPALNFLTANALFAADVVFVPVESGSKLALLVTDDMLRFIAEARAEATDAFTGRMLAAVNGMRLDMLAAVAWKDYDDRRRRQAEGIAKAKDAGRFKGRPADTERRATIRAALEKGLSWSWIVSNLDTSRATVAAVAAELRTAD